MLTVEAPLERHRPVAAALARRLRSLVVAGVALGALGYVVASPPAVAGARFDACFDEAKRALTAGDGPSARTGFEACLGVADGEGERWRALLGLALARHTSGELAMALTTYRRFLDESAASEDPGWLERRSTAEREAEALSERVLAERAEIVVRSATPGASCEVDGAASDVVHRDLPATLYLAPGERRIRVVAPGFVPEELSVELSAGQRIVVQRDLTPIRPETPDPPEDVTDRGRDVPGAVGTGPGLKRPGLRAGTTQREAPDPAPWIVLGGGVAAVAAGAVCTGLALGDAGRLDELQGEPLDDAVRAEDAKLRGRVRDYETASWVLYGVGAVAVVTGVVLAVTDDDDTGSDVDVVVEPRRGGGTAGLRLSF